MSMLAAMKWSNQISLKVQAFLHAISMVLQPLQLPP